MLKELFIRDLLTQRNPNAEILLVNLETNKFAFQDKQNEQMIILSDLNYKETIFTFSTQAKTFTRVNSNATIIIYEIEHPKSLFSSVLGIFGKINVPKFYDYELFNLARLNFTQVRLNREIIDVIERNEHSFIILTNEGQLFEYKSTSQEIRKLYDLEIKPFKMLANENDIYLIGLKTVRKLSGRLLETVENFTTDFNIDNCFITEDFMVTLKQKNSNLMSLNSIDLKTLNIKSSVEIKSKDDEMVDLFLGVVPFIDYQKGTCDDRVLVSISKRETALDVFLVGQKLKTKTEFWFHKLENLTEKFNIDTNYNIENRNLFLSGVFWKNEYEMRGIVTNYDSQLENSILIQEKKQKKNRKMETGAKYLSLQESEIISLENCKIFAEILNSCVDDQFEITFEKSKTADLKIENCLLPLIETTLENSKAKLLSDLMYFKVDECFVFQDQGDFLNLVINKLMNRFKRQFSEIKSKLDLTILKVKTVNLQNLTSVYLAHQHLLIKNSTQYQYNIRIEFQYEDFIEEIENAIVKIKQDLLVIEIWEFFLQNDILTNQNPEDEKKDQNASEIQEEYSINSNDDSPVLLLKLVNFNNLFEIVNREMQDQDSPLSVKLLLNELCEYNKSINKYVVMNEHVLKPVLLFEHFSTVCDVPNGLNDMKSVFGLLSNKSVPVNMKMSFILYYLIKSANFELIERFKTHCSLRNNILENVESLVYLDSLIYIFKPTDPESETKNDIIFNQQLSKFAYLYRPTLNENTTNFVVLKNAAMMNAIREISAILASDFVCFSDQEFQTLSKILISKGMTFAIYGEYLKFSKNFRLPEKDRLEFDRPLIIFLTSEMKSAGLKISNLFLTDTKYGCWNPLLGLNAVSDFELNIYELIIRMQYKQAYDYYQEHCFQNPELSLPINFFLKLIQIQLKSDLKTGENDSRVGDSFLFGSNLSNTQRLKLEKQSRPEEQPILNSQSKNINQWKNEIKSKEKSLKRIEDWEVKNTQLKSENK